MTDHQKFLLLALTLGMLCVLFGVFIGIVLIAEHNGGLDALFGLTSTRETSHNINAPSQAQEEQTQTSTVAPTLKPTLTAMPSLTNTLQPTATATPIPNTGGQIAQVIGYSVEGRPLEIYRFGSGAKKRLIFAGIHGGYEYNTVDLANELIVYLRDHLDSIPSNISLYILPVLNIDGFTNYKAQYIGRPNANGADLNRNWDINWQEDWDKTGCWNYVPIHGGTAPFSEPETLALSQFMLEENIEAVISYHSAALGIFHGGQSEPHPPSVSLAQAIAAVSPYQYPGKSGYCTSTGMSAHWAAENGIAAVDIELTNHSETDFDINLRILTVFLNWQQ